MTGASPAGPGPRDGEHRQFRRGEPTGAVAVQGPGALGRAQSVAAEKQENHRHHHTDGQPRRPEGHGHRPRCYLGGGDDDEPCAWLRVTGRSMELVASCKLMACERLLCEVCARL
jgi:hypothetical protein